MTLTSALGIATRSLSLAQEGITLASNNIANVATPGYVKQKNLQASIVVDGQGVGAEIVGVVSDIDRQLVKSLQDQSSELGLNTTLESYFENIQRLYGQPGADNSLSNAIDSFFSAYQDLSNNPSTPSLRVAALNATKGLAGKVSDVATGLEKLRFTADGEINTIINNVNNILGDINNLNSQVVKFGENSAGRANLEQQMYSRLRELSQYLNISVSFTEKGAVSILTGNGTALIDDSTVTKLRYTPAASVDQFISGGSLTALEVVVLNGDGSFSNTSTPLVTSGVSSDITTTLASGSLLGLVTVRDRTLPDLVDQLDTLAKGLTDEINALHNDGSGFPPASSLTGTTEVNSNTEIGFSGSVMIAIINRDGTPALSPFTDEDYQRPLTLDLGSIDSGGTNGVGFPSVQDIINEINEYYGPVQNRAVVGNLRDIKLAAVSDSISDAGTAQFDLLLDNTSTLGSTVVIQSVTVIDPNDASTGYTAATLPSPNSYTVDPGDRERTGQSFTVNFGGDDNRAIYTIRVRVQVTDGDGNISVADIDYNMSDNISDIKNDKFSAEAVSVVSGDAQFYSAPVSNNYAHAELVDANGNPVAAGQDGFLRITTATGQNYGISIAELDSRETGVPGTRSADITNRGFSHYFGLNNLFIDNGQLEGSAVNMAVREDIKADANLLTTAGLVLSNQPDDPDQALYTYETGSGNNRAALRISELDQQNIFFAAAGDLPSINITFSGYSADIIGSMAASALQASRNKDSTNLGMDGLLTLFQKSAGVNTDEELSHIIELQNHFQATAKIISVVQRLFEILGQAIS